MNKVKEKILDKKELILICLSIVFILMLPFFDENMLIGTDYEYHFTRIKSIQETLQEGVFPVKIHMNMANGYGYGTGFFYPNFFLYIPAFICMMGVDFFISYKIFIAIMLVLMFAISYKSFKTVLDDKNTSLIATILYMLSNCITLQLYERAALGEFLGLVFIPAVVAGMYDYTHKDFKNPWLLALGFFGVISSHLITTLLCAIYAIIVLLINIKSTIKDGKKFIRLIITAVLVAMLTMSFWAPMFEQMSLAKYRFNEPWTSADMNVFGLYDLFTKHENSVGLLITLCLPLIVLALFDKNISKKTKRYIIEFIVLIVIMCSQWFWEITKPVTGMIQFKWRLLGIASVVICIGLANILREYCYKYEINLKAATVIITMFAVICFFYQNSELEFYREDMVTAKLYSFWNSLGGGREYLPLETDVGVLNKPGRIIADDGTELPRLSNYGRFEFEKTNSEQNIMNPQLIYYYGYVADITKEDGTVEPVELRKNEDGLVELVTEGKTGHVRIWYNGTKIQKISYLVTAIAAVLVLGLGVIKIIKNKNKK